MVAILREKRCPKKNVTFWCVRVPMVRALRSVTLRLQMAVKYQSSARVLWLPACAMRELGDENLPSDTRERLEKELAALVDERLAIEKQANRTSQASVHSGGSAGMMRAVTPSPHLPAEGAARSPPPSLEAPDGGGLHLRELTARGVRSRPATRRLQPSTTSTNLSAIGARSRVAARGAPLSSIRCRSKGPRSRAGPGQRARSRSEDEPQAATPKSPARADRAWRGDASRRRHLKRSPDCARRERRSSVERERLARGPDRCSPVDGSRSAF
jgi:hypothetical protein